MSSRLQPGESIVTSFHSPDSTRCVDVFARADGSFAFEEFRADPEAGGGWTLVGGLSGMRFASAEEALSRVRRSVRCWQLQINEPRVTA